MPGFRLGPFTGEKPGLHKRRLAPTDAQTCTNVRIQRGSLRPLRAPTTVVAKTIAGTLKSIFKYNNFWFEWDKPVSALRSLIPNDAYDRVYFTGDAEPKFTESSIATTATPYPTNSYTLGIPAPTTAPTATLSGSATDPTELPETRYYVVTYLDAYGSEGPPSPVSNSVEWRNGQTVDLSTLATAPSGNYNITQKRIYRLNTGDTGSVYQLVATVDIASTTYTDSVASADLGRAIVSEDFDMPPTALEGLIRHPNGFYVGYYANVLCFSEPGYPHAWPAKYQLTTDHDIMGIGALGNSILVTTKSFPAIASGTDPAGMVMDDTEVEQACVSKTGVVDLGYGVAYPSPDGLILASPSGLKVVTQGVFDRDAWQALKPDSFVAVNWEGMYLAFYNDGVTQASFAMYPAQPELGVFFFQYYTQAVYQDREADQVYIDNGGNIASWDTGANASMTYKSREFISPKPENMSVAVVRADAYPITLKVYADAALVHTQSVANNLPFRLPSGSLPEIYEVQVEGSNEVSEVVVATSMKALRGV